MWVNKQWCSDAKFNNRIPSSAKGARNMMFWRAERWCPGRTATSLHLDLGLWASRTWENILLLCGSHPVCGVVLWQPEQTTDLTLLGYLIELCIRKLKQIMLMCVNKSTMCWALPVPGPSWTSPVLQNVISLHPSHCLVCGCWILNLNIIVLFIHICKPSLCIHSFWSIESTNNGQFLVLYGSLCVEY